MALQEQHKELPSRGMEAHGYSSHSAVCDSSAPSRAVSLSSPICNRVCGHVCCLSLAGWWTLTSVVCGECGGIYDDHIIIYQGLWG